MPDPERATFSKSVERVLADNPVLSYDETLAKEVCHNLGIEFVDPMKAKKAFVRIRTFIEGLREADRDGFVRLYTERYAQRTEETLIEREVSYYRKIAHS